MGNVVEITYMNYDAELDTYLFRIVSDENLLGSIVLREDYKNEEMYRYLREHHPELLYI